MKSGVTRGRSRVYLVDDHPLVRLALKTTLCHEQDLEVCGEAEDRTDALKGIAASDADLAIIDLHLKNSHGLELVRDLQNQHPNVLTLVLSSLEDESLNSERAIRAGARGYISKREPPARIMEAVRKVLGGEIYWSPKAAAQIASKIAINGRNGHNDNGTPADRLSERELQVFEQIGLGRSTQQIAQNLFIDVTTVETYRARIKEKLQLRDGSELLQTAIRWNPDRVVLT
jgi:DNA-binding NarL/FixJ family response regulator